MVSSGQELYCGEPALPLSSFFKRDPEGGIAALFRDRKTFFSYNTRVAIFAGCKAIGLKPGDEVLAPAYNCGSELDPLHVLGLHVKLYPVGRNLLADPDRVEPLITKRTRAIYVTHYFGALQSKMSELRALCDRYGLRLIEDCALSLLSGAAPVEGRHGDVAVFCFHKFVPTPEGGALVVNAPDMNVTDPFPLRAPGKKVLKSTLRTGAQAVLGAARFNRLMQSRRSRNAPVLAAQDCKGQLSDIPAHYYFDNSLAGCRIDRVTAMALGSISASEVVSARRRNWKALAGNLSNVDGAELVLPELADKTCPQNLPIYVKNRDQVAQALQARGVMATPWWAGYNKNLDWSGQDEAVDLKESILGLPVHQALTPDHQDYISELLQSVITKLG